MYMGECKQNQFRHRRHTLARAHTHTHTHTHTQALTHARTHTPHTHTHSTTECCPGVKVFLHLSHLRQKLCQSLPSDVLRSARREHKGERNTVHLFRECETRHIVLQSVIDQARSKTLTHHIKTIKEQRAPACSVIEPKPSFPTHRSHKNAMQAYQNTPPSCRMDTWAFAQSLLV